MACLAAGASLVAARAATGHPVTSRTENNRYVRLTLSEKGLRVGYLVLYGELPAFYVRRAADTNRDGLVSDEEARAHAVSLAASLAASSLLVVNGVRVPLRLPDVAVAVGEPRVGPTPWSVEAWEWVPLGSGRVLEVSFDAGGDLPRLGETEVLFETKGGTRLVGACRGRPPCTAPAQEPRFVFMGPKVSSMEDRTVSCRFEVARGWFSVSKAGVATLAVAAAVVGAGAAFLSRRRGRVRSARSAADQRRTNG